MSKKTTVHFRCSFGGIPFPGEEIKLTGRWKTSIINDDNVVISFEDRNGLWWRDDMLVVKTVEEYINDCSHT